MPCTSCASENLGKFTGEVSIHFPGLENVDKPQVYVCSTLVVCVACGVAQFVVPEAELGRLTHSGQLTARTAVGA